MLKKFKIYSYNGKNMSTYYLMIVAYIICLIIFAGFSILLIQVLSGFFGYWLYEIGLNIYHNLYWLFPTVIVIGWYYITDYFFSKPQDHLNEIVNASKLIANPTVEPIVLVDELKDVESELNSIREKALIDKETVKNADRRKNDLLVYLAHDLKTPLTSVIGYLSLLNDEKDISKKLREKYTGIAFNKANHLETLINEFFDVTRYNLSDIDLRKSSINITMLLYQLVSEFELLLTEKNIKCNIFAKKEIMLTCDVDKMQRVFDNLLRNAIYYSYEGTEIEISVENEKDNIKISIKNHGDTISQNNLNRIFEQFYRLDNSRTTNNGGSGLGLAISKQIVLNHGGTIEAKSNDEIIEFIVTLPCK